MSYKLNFENNTSKILSEFDKQIDESLNQIKAVVVRDATNLAPVGTAESTGIPGYRGGTLRQSIDGNVNNTTNTVTVGSNVEYAA